MDSQDPFRWISELTKDLKDSPDGSTVWSCITNAVYSAFFARERDIKADLPYADTYATFFKGALYFAIFPYARCPQYADNLGIHGRMSAWNWISGRIRRDNEKGDWMHAGSLEAITDVFSSTSQLMGYCRFPLFITPTIARGCFDIWKSINECRMRRQGAISLIP